MEIRFNTKEESNLERKKAFLALSGHERFLEFLALSRRVMKFKTQQPTEKESDNFIISKPNEQDLEK